MPITTIGKPSAIMHKVPMRVKSRMSLRNGMWYGVRNGIIMRNTISVKSASGFRANFIRAALFSMLWTLAEYQTTKQQIED